MYSWNEYHPVNAITTEGIRGIHLLGPGDKLYEYNSINKFTIVGITNPNPDKVFKVTYTDGRFEEYSYYDRIYISKNKSKMISEIFHVHDHQEPIPGYTITFPRGLGEIIPCAIEYGLKIPHPTPDPYIAGALLTYGDFDDEYINLPLWTDKINNLFAHKYDIEYAEKLSKDKVYFAHKSDLSKPITWKEMFNQHDMFAITHHINSPLIPVSYMYGSIADRWQYIRGAFDAGYDRTIFPDSIGCAGYNGNHLKDLQTMLWSLGVMSKITYLPTETNGRIYHLEIIGKYCQYPGFFYDPDNIAKILHLQNHTIDQLTDFALRVKSISYECNGVISNVIADGWPKVYYSENFIPRLSE